jgi:hypothetical protein
VPVAAPIGAVWVTTRPPQFKHTGSVGFGSTAPFMPKSVGRRGCAGTDGLPRADAQNLLSQLVRLRCGSAAVRPLDVS